MKMGTQRTKALGAKNAFTLIELLAVIAIIALLAGILVPAVNQVRLQAKKTATNSDIASLTTGIQSFRSDQRLGGGLPPSASDWADASGNLLRKVKSPYTKQNISGDIDIGGAGLLTWALAGADLLGTPGFRTVRSGSSTFWGQDTDDLTGGIYSMGATAPNKDQPAFTRSGPFVDLTKVRITKMVRSGSPSNQPSFDIPAELEARAALGLPAVQRQYPMFLDSFGFPILYWRADPAGLKMADKPMNNLPATERGKYHYDDNGYLVDGSAQSNYKVLILQASSAKRLGGRIHSLDWSPKPPIGGAGGGASGGADRWPEATFQKYICNDDVKVRPEPHNPDSFLLISPGPDGLYGTSDDIANFPHNGKY